MSFLKKKHFKQNWAVGIKRREGSIYNLLFLSAPLDSKSQQDLWKGQLISEQIHAVLNFPKMQRGTVVIT